MENNQAQAPAKLSTTTPSQDLALETAKIVILGCDKAGKTKFVERFKENTYIDEYRMTHGAAYSCKEIQSNEKRVKLQIWDTAGHEKYCSLLSLYLQADIFAVFVLFSLAQPEKFEKVEEYLELVKEKCPPGTHVLLVGTQADLRSSTSDGTSLKMIGDDEIQAFAGSHGLQYIEISAKEGNNVNEAFQIVVDGVIKRSQTSGPEESKKSSDHSSKPSCAIF